MDSSPRGSARGAQRKRRRLRYERRIRLFTWFVALPGLLVSGILIWLQPWSLESKLALFAAELFAWWIMAAALWEQTTRPLQTLANVLSALREEDYSFRARGAALNDALGELSLEVNALADELADQRIGSIEATALLRRVVEEVEVPLFAFDPHRILRLVNPAGERLLQEPDVRVLGFTAEELGLESCLTAENGTLLPLNLNSPSARWLIRRSTFRQRGVPHTLVVLSDVSRALREEERKAWQRLIRVLGHELNNSLASIKSIAGSLNSRVSQSALNPEEQEDFGRGLEIIESRAAALNRFLQAYRKLAQMPPPNLRRVNLTPIVERVAVLETRLKVKVNPGPPIELAVDPDQLEQMLINLLHNAVEATLEQVGSANLSDEKHAPGAPSSNPEVVMGWNVSEKEIVLTIEDNGPGLLNPSNAFVPFYTTKPSGSGIGLVLSRQIAEAHGGSLELLNGSNRRGCVARIALPRSETTSWVATTP
jgi:two-component system nitrogen regulation sensor histidine kinase NtrY